MKKSLFVPGFVLIAAMTLAACVKEQPANQPVEQPVIEEGVPFELFAGVSTKTVTEDASDINWVADDALNVFEGEHGSALGSNCKFSITSENLSSNTFTGTLPSALDAEKSYDWKVIYPYDKNILTVSTHTSGKGYLVLGSKSNETQIQVGNNTKAHLAGSHMPLYGKAENVSGSSSPSIELSQVMSVVKVHVTNGTNDPLTVTSVSFTAPTGTLISGTFYVDYSGDTPEFESSGPSYTTNVASLTVTSGEAIAKNDAADFYIAIKPFTAAASSQLKVSVNGSEKALNVAAATEFQAGKVKTLNFTYSEAAVSNTIAEVLAGGAGKYNLSNLLVYAANNNNAIVGDNTGKMLLYKSGHGFVEGDIINVTEATVTVYNGVLEISGGSMTKVSGGNPVDHGTALDLNVEANAASLPTTDGWYSAKYVTFKGPQSGQTITGKYLKFYLNTANAATNNKDVVATGYVYSYSTSFDNHSFHARELTENSNTLALSPTFLNWAASETDAKTITVTLNGGASGYTVSPASDTNFTISDDGAGTVTVTPKAVNTSTETAKTLTLTFTHADDDMVIKKLVCTQEKASTGGDVEVLNEVFDNTSSSDSSSAISSSTFPNFSGATSKAYKSKYGGIKLGTGSANGYITSKPLNLSNSFTVKVNVLQYGSDAGKVQVTVGSVTKEITPTGTDTQYSLDFDAATSSSTVKIGTTAKRAYIDNVIIIRHD